MQARDILRFAWQAITGHPGRSGLILLAMGIGVAAVVVLTALGEGARRYVTGEFTSLGTHLLIVLPGRSETVGGPPPLLGVTPRDLTLDDALALYRNRAIHRVAPVVAGEAPVSRQGKQRDLNILGSNTEIRAIRHLEMAAGRFLPSSDPHRTTPVAVIGHTAKQELFGHDPAVGRWLRIGDRRFRVIGVLAEMGESLGLNTNDTVIIPVASAQALFDRPSLFRILIEARSNADIAPAKQAVKDIIRTRHDGEDDITVITQDALLSTFDRIFDALTYTLGGIAAISLCVAGILVMNVMLVAVSQRTAEIGLLKALGAPPRTILRIFLTEAVLLSAIGAVLGLAVGLFAVWAGGRIYPVLPLTTPPWALAAGLVTALGAGLLFGILPARRAVRLDPVQALSRR